MKKLIAATVALLLSLTLQAELKPLQVMTKEKDLETIRTFISEGFEEILESPVMTYQDDFMEILLVPNGIATQQELFCEVRFKETEKGTQITAKAFYRNGHSKTECADYATRKGVFLVIEGAALACDDEIAEQFAVNLAL